MANEPAREVKGADEPSLDLLTRCRGHSLSEEGSRTRAAHRLRQSHYFPGEVSTRTAGLTTTKILFNSVLFTPGA
jgi:hypothetical protein